MQKKWIFLTGLLVCLLAGAWAYYSYNKPRTGVEGKEAAFTISATELYKAYYSDEAVAGEQYTDKILIVKGAVTHVEKSKEVVILVLSSGEALGGVSCQLSDKDGDLWPQVGDTVSVKGRCSGFLMDVNLVDAVLLK